MLSIAPCYPLPVSKANKVSSVVQKSDYRFEWIVSNPFSTLWLGDGELRSPFFYFANACFKVSLIKKRPPSSPLSWITVCIKNWALPVHPGVQVKLGIVGIDGKDQNICSGDTDVKGEFWARNWMLPLVMKNQMVNHVLTIFCELRILGQNIQTTSLPKTPQSNDQLKEEKGIFTCSIVSFQPQKSKGNDQPKEEKGIFTCSIVSFQPQKPKGKGKPTEDDDLFSCLGKGKSSIPKSKGKRTEDDDLFSFLEKEECPKSKSKGKPTEDDDLFSFLEKEECPKSKSQVLPTKYEDPLLWTEEDLEVFRQGSQVKPKKEEDPLRLFCSEEDSELFRPRNEVRTENKTEDKDSGSSSGDKVETSRSKDEVRTENKTEDKDVGSSSVEKVETSRSKGVDKVLQGLKGLLASEEQSDVILKLKGKCFKVHKLILGMRSPVFHSMFAHDMIEKETGEVNIDDCDSEYFPDFLSYLYTGSIDNLSASNVFSLYLVADKYCVDELKEECVECMTKILSADTFCDILTLALWYNEKDLVERSTLFFKDKMKEIIVTAKWQTFLHENSIAANELLIKALLPEK